MSSSPSDPARVFHACAYPTVWRLIAGILVGVSRASVLVVLAALLTSEGPVTLMTLVRALTTLALLPGLAAWLIERAYAVEVVVRDGELLLRRYDLAIEIPCSAIARVTPWSMPLPGGGFALRMQSGRRFGYGLQAADAAPLLSALADGGAAGARAASEHPIVAYARAQHSVAPWRWYHLLGKFIGFALLPTAVWFYAHQHIAYGALLGQYYLEGLRAYVTTFAISWGLASIYLLLYASAWRAVAEAVALLAAWMAPSHTERVRRLAEVVCRVVYYGGVPVLLAVPFLL